ncbi:MAG TPA: DUF1801 domain-containing protein [Bacteroidia bacterium]|nr:DUF1801 domain-containing protein [Bacteroidia bacterium]
MNKDIQAYNDLQSPEDREICNILSKEISRYLPSKLKNCVRLLFWSGQSFDEQVLQKEGTFKAAEARYTSAKQINKTDLKRWLKKSIKIQWDYKNIVKRKGVLERLK